jgi:DNA-directed RNA polymerase specialized sigma24 family protein
MDHRQPKPPPTPEIIALIDREWPDLRRRFVAVALKNTQNLAVAEDLVSKTYAGIRSGSRHWDRVRDPDFTAFAASALLSNIDNWRTLAENRRRDWTYDVYAVGDEDPETGDGLRKPKLAASSLAPSPEEMAMIREEIERAFAVSFEPDGVEYALLALFKRGVCDTLEQAKILGMSVDAVRELIQRVDRIINNTLIKQRKTS